MLSVITLMVVFILDILDKPSEILSNIDNNILSVSIIGIVLLAFLWSVHQHAWSNLKIASVNNVDFLIIYGLVISSVGFTVWLILYGFLCYKSLCSFIIVLASFIFLILRIVKVSSVFNNNTKSNLWDLKDIYEGNLSVDPDQPILLSEKDVDYDLLGRTGMITLIEKYITTYTADSSFVIGIVGEWGSGKTTILNNVKRDLVLNNDIIVIDNFDPWVFGTQETLLIAMYENILKHTGIKLSVSQNNNMIRVLSDTVSELSSSALNISAISKVIGNLSNTNNAYDDADNLKKLIGDHLISQNKTVVFMIDNIDRAESENIIFLFKLIGTIFDLPNIIYVLSYDRERVEDILQNTNKIDPKYIEKIVQQEVHVPTPPEERLRELYYMCMGNILIQYGVDKEGLKLYKPILDFVCENVKSVRNFKRLINSAFTSAFLNDCKLNGFTLLTLEIISFLEPKLYYSISDNRQFYISEDTIYDLRLYQYSFNKEQRTSNLNKYFSELFITFPNYKYILSYLFPNVKNYAKDIIILPQENQNQKKTKKSFPIYSVKFFDLYFSYGVNDFYRIRSTVKEVIKTITYSNNKEDIKTQIIEKIIFQSPEFHKEYAETLNLFVDDIQAQKSLWVIEALWENIYSIDNSIEFMALDGRQRILVVIAELLNKIKDNELNDFLNIIKKDYGHLCLLFELLSWVRNEKTGGNSKAYDAIFAVYSNLCTTVVNNKVDLYDNTNYSFHNILGLIWYYSENTQKDLVLKPYFEDIFNEKNIYRMIGDAIRCSIGSVYGYSISEDVLKCLYLEQDMINKAVIANPPTTDSEKVVLDIYKKYILKEYNYYDRPGIVSTTEIKFDL